MKAIIQFIKKMPSPMFLAFSAIIVINVFGILYPTTFTHPSTRLLKSTIIAFSSTITGFFLGTISEKNKCVGDVIKVSLAIISLAYITPYLVHFVPGIFFVIIGWIGSLYLLEIKVLTLAKEINQTQNSKKEGFLQIAKVLIDVLASVVVVIEFLNILIPLFVPQ